MYMEAELNVFDVTCASQPVYHTRTTIHQWGEGKSQGSTADPEASELGYIVTGHCLIASRKLDWRLNRLWKRTEG